MKTFLNFGLKRSLTFPQIILKITLDLLCQIDVCIIYFYLLRVTYICQKEFLQMHNRDVLVILCVRVFVLS